MSESVQPSAPWLLDDAFPEKPPGSDYGYIEKGKQVPCTREELIRMSTLSSLQLVWHPDTPRIVPAEQVPFLRDALKERLRKRLHWSLGFGTVCLMMYGGIMCIEWGHHSASMNLLLFLAFGVIPVVQSTYGLQKFKNLPTQELLGDGSATSFGAWVDSRPVRFTWALLGLLVLVFCVEVFQLEHAIDAAGLDKEAVRHGQWWRLFTGPLLHESVLHLAFNALALIGLGRLVELLASRYHMILVFAVSAFSGSICSLFLLPHTTSVGASGGILGFIGFLGVLGWRRRQLMPSGFSKSVIINIAVIAAMGIVAFTIVDNAAHFGGLVGGAIMGVLLVSQHDQRLPLACGPAVKALGILSLVLTAFFGVFAIVKMLTP